MFDISLNETIYSGGFLLGKDVYVDGKHRIKNITFNKYLYELGFVEFSENIDNLKNIAVVWHYDKEGDMYITQIYDHDTGEVFFENHDDEWTDADDEITNALLMWGNLEQTIGELY